MPKTQGISYICRNCLSVGTPIRVSTKNPELKGISRAINGRQGFVGALILGFMAHKDKPLGCNACESTDIVPLETPVGKMLLAQSENLNP